MLALAAFFVGLIGLLVVVRVLISFGYSLSWFRRGPRGFEVKQPTGGTPVLREDEMRDRGTNV